MIAGAILVTFSGLAAASMWSSLTNRIDVLAAADLIGDGQIITESDLKEVSIAADSGVKAMSPSDREELIGQVATGPIGAGSIIHPAQFMADDAEGQPQVIVGAALQPGQYPRAGILPGDAVKIIETSGPNVQAEEDDTGPREIARGEIAEVRELTQSDVLLVSIRVDEAVSASISELVEQERISLALLDEIPDDLVEPTEAGTPLEPGEPFDDESAEKSTDEPTNTEAGS